MEVTDPYLYSLLEPSGDRIYPTYTLFKTPRNKCNNAINTPDPSARYATFLVFDCIVLIGKKAQTTSVCPGTAVFTFKPKMSARWTFATWYLLSFSFFTQLIYT